jgi:hypothetical protein
MWKISCQQTGNDCVVARKINDFALHNPPVFDEALRAGIITPARYLAGRVVLSELGGTSQQDGGEPGRSVTFSSCN